MEDYSSLMFASVLFFKPCLSDAKRQSPVTHNLCFAAARRLNVASFSFI